MIHTNRTVRLTGIGILFFSLFLFSGRGIAQSDTLHIYYKGLEVRVLDSNETKIGNWAKSLNGKKVDIEVIAYYNDASLKKYSQERCDELYITLNRKARTLINIKSIGPKKGVKSQRTVADIVYSYPGSTAVAEEKGKEKEKKNEGAAKAAAAGAVIGATAANEAAKSEKAPKEEKKAKKESNKETAAESPAAGSPESATEKPAKAEKAPKEEKAAKPSKHEYVMDTTYVNGVMKVTKRKVKKQ